MSKKLLLQGQNEETFLPRVLRVFAKQGLQVQDLRMHAEADRLTLEVNLDDLVDETVLKVLTKQCGMQLAAYAH